MNTTLICIVCPVSCPCDVEWTEEGGVTKVENNQCKLAFEYVEGELFDPRRMLTTSVPIDGGNWPLVSVKSHVPIPKDQMLEAMKVIADVRATAPIKVGDVIMPDFIGSGADLVATRNVTVA